MVLPLMGARMLDLTPLIHNWLVPALSLIGAGLVVWIVLRTRNWLDAHAAFLSAAQREKIATVEQNALQQGVDYVLAWVDRQGAQVHPKVNSWLLRQGAQVAIDHASGTLADNGWSPDDVANKLLAKLPPVAVTADASKAVVMPASYSDKVDVSPLPPISTPTK